MFHRLLSRAFPRAAELTWSQGVGSVQQSMAPEGSLAPQLFLPHLDMGLARDRDRISGHIVSTAMPLPEPELSQH